jgi:predicted O-methyltransferase YrrM
MMRRALRRMAPAIDVIASPLTLLATTWLRVVRSLGAGRMPVSRALFTRMGLLPIHRHYYEPLFDPRELPPADERRELPGIDWNIEEQLALLRRFDFHDELMALPVENDGSGRYHYRNDNFVAGDAEFLYGMIRLHRPRLIVEIGSGFSTLMAKAAVERNGAERGAAPCRQVCIEPYEMPWLERAGVEVVRRRVELVERTLFEQLGADDILFIDSSHIIRPGGDVLFEFLDLLPRLRPGVLVHVHDIFTPRHYPRTWLERELRLWNEQYLLEAFLTGNRDFKVIGALSLLAQRHRAELAKACPVFARDPSADPGSFWMVRR